MLSSGVLYEKVDDVLFYGCHCHLISCSPGWGWVAINYASIQMLMLRALWPWKGWSYQQIIPKATWHWRMKVLMNERRDCLETRRWLHLLLLLVGKVKAWGGKEERPRDGTEIHFLGGWKLGSCAPGKGYQTSIGARRIKFSRFPPSGTYLLCQHEMGSLIRILVWR